MASERIVLFEHIPKTAGSTVNFILNRYYASVFHIKGDDPLKSVAEFKSFHTGKQKCFDLVHGHCALEVESFLQHPLLITFLRDPVDQFLSQFYFIKEKKKHLFHEAVNRLDSIEAYIHYAKRHSQDNLQCRLLSRNHSWITSDAEEAAVDPAVLFSRAEEKLKQFDLLLLTERFDESLLLARQKLGWKKQPYYFRANQTPGKPLRKTIDPSVIRKIEELQVYDRMLYRQACQRFESFANELPSKQELAKFQGKNRLYQNSIYPIKKFLRSIPGLK